MSLYYFLGLAIMNFFFWKCQILWNYIFEWNYKGDENLKNGGNPRAPCLRPIHHCKKSIQ